MDLVGRWEVLVQSEQFERLAQELWTWQTATLSDLESFLDRHEDAELESLVPELQALPREFPASFFTGPLWPMHKARVRSLQTRLAEGRQHFLVAVGPTPQPSVNAIMLQLALVQENPEWATAAGDSIFSEIKNLRRWGQSLESEQALDSLLASLEAVAFSMLSQPDVGALRDQVWGAWEAFTNAYQDGGVTALQEGPTRSGRWNSWILLLASVEAEESDPHFLLESLDELDNDIHELEALGGSENVRGCIQDYLDASGQLRELLESGRRVKGWSQILPPLLEEIDHLLTSPAEVEQLGEGTSPLRQLCLRFEESQIGLDTFRQGLDDFATSVDGARRKAAIARSQDDSETQFLKALKDIEEGLQALRLIQSPSQGRQIEAGCGLVQDGLEQLQQLRAATSRP